MDQLEGRMMQPVDPRFPQALPATTSQQLQLDLQGPPPLPINSSELTSANIANESARNEESEDEDQSENEE